MELLNEIEIHVLEFLSDGKEHFDEPDIEDYDEICEYLSEHGLVNLGETKDEGYKLTYKGKRLWIQYQKEQEKNMEKLEYIILDVLSLHGNKINQNIQPDTQIYDFKELRLYTMDEITECSIRMKEKGWITCLIDGGPAYWHQLTEKGRIALRNYIRNNHNVDKHNAGDSNDESLIKALLPIFYGEEFRDIVIDYVNKMRNTTSNPEKVSYTADLVKQKVISEMQCHRPLWKILNEYGLYPLKEGTWNKMLKKNLDKG